MVGDGDELVGNVSREFFLDTVRCRATRRYEPYAMADTEHMGVDGKGSLTPHDGLDDVSGLTTYTG